MNFGGVAVAILGVMLITQVLGGSAFERLKLDTAIKGAI